jgi:hypothetical protein
MAIPIACAHRATAEQAAPSAQPQSPVATSMAQALELHGKARESLSPALNDYSRSLVSALSSTNPYERRLAMERLAVIPAQLDIDAAAALVPRLSEGEKLHSEQCARSIESLSQRYGGQGQEIEYARCQYQGGTSNGTLAGKLVRGLLYQPAIAPQILGMIAAFVREHPVSVETVLASLDDAADAVGSAAVAELPKAGDTAGRVALLRLAIAGHCGSVSIPASLEPVIASMRSKERRVRDYAALALLRLGVCNNTKVDDALEPHRQAAVSLVEARLNDAKDTATVTEVAWLGAAATVFVPALLRRLDLTPQQSRDIIVAIGAAGIGAAPAVPKLTEILRNRKASHFHETALVALGRIGALAAPAKGTIVDLVTRETHLSTEGLQALANMFARLGPDEFSRLNKLYQEQCKNAGSVPFFSFSRDDRCRKQMTAMSSIAERSGTTFREVGWRKGDADED